MGASAALAALIIAVVAATPALSSPVSLPPTPWTPTAASPWATCSTAPAGRRGGGRPAQRAHRGARRRPVQAAAARAGLDWGNADGPAPHRGAQGRRAPPTQTSAAAGRPGATVEVLTYARSLAAGEMVQPEDLVWAKVQAHQAPADAPQDAESVIGLAARRALRAGPGSEPRPDGAPGDQGAATWSRSPSSPAASA